MTRPSALALMAFGSAALASGGALADAVHLALRLPQPFNFETSTPAMLTLGAALQALVFAVLAVVLWQFTRRPDATTRTGLWALRVTAVADAVLAVVYGYGVVTAGVFPPALEAVAGPAFVTVFVAGAVGGATLLRHASYRWAGVLLLAPVPVLVIVGVAAALGWHGAHPAYAEVFAYFGAALLSVPSVTTASSAEPETGRTTSQPARRYQDGTTVGSQEA